MERRRMARKRDNRRIKEEDIFKKCRKGKQRNEHVRNMRKENGKQEKKEKGDYNKRIPRKQR